ncbi:hypothetical protein [Rufibacter sp. LB8]|uniref:hypothetical protein n=1 Tax=Rufibacter sp. LB8 TaxID=2777781 RepID=UPI00178C3BF4|nr:hypothetical protein [Rufibacter sp. LB8]
MRGREVLYDQVFPTSVNLGERVKGQRHTQTDRRDEDLTYRYYYWGHLKRKRYDDSLAELEKEFYITAAVVVQRLDKKRDLLKDLVARKALPRELKKRLPHFDWQLDK